MRRKAFFMESKLETFSTSECDKCGLLIKKVQDGKTFWNPDPGARGRNICRNCFNVFTHAKKEKYRIWREKHEELEALREHAI